MRFSNYSETRFSIPLSGFLLLLCCVTLVQNVSARIVGGRKPLVLNGVPSAVSSGLARELGLLEATKRLKFAISLPLQNETALEQLITQIYDPASPNYHQYLSVDEFTARFSATQADYDAVVAWAKAQGLTVTTITRNRHIVDVEGSVDSIDAALGVTMKTYQHPTENRQFFAPDREPTIDLAVPILAITGLDNYTLPHPQLLTGSGPIANAGSGPGGSYLPSDMRKAYYGNGPLNGVGQRVGIVSFDGYLSSDVQTYFADTGMTSTVPITNVYANGFSGVCDGEDGTQTTPCVGIEQVIDIVNVIGMAPGISEILFYEGASGPDILNRMATDNLAKVLSCSWSSSDMGTAADPIFAEFQVQGQTFVNATGDNGTYSVNNDLSWGPPSSNYRVLEVGGTVLSTASGAWSSESAWPGGGGGFYAAAGYSIPSYQQAAGVITAANHGSTIYRNDPDVAAEADFDNAAVSDGVLYTTYGGTSFAAPRWAGYITLANEQAALNGKGPLGFVNPSIYSIGVSAQSANFHDVTTGTDGIHAVAGYDLATGWGSPNGATLINSLSGSATTAGFLVSAYPSLPVTAPGAGATSMITTSVLNGFTGTISFSAFGLPDGVTAAFSPSTVSAGGTTTLTLSASNSVAAGTTSAITVVAISGATTQTTVLNLFVGNPPSALVLPGNFFFNAVASATEVQYLFVEDAAGSQPLSYNIGAFSSSDGSCRGSVPWLSIDGISGGTVTGGVPTKILVQFAPSAVPLGIGNYAAEICVTTSDSSHPLFVTHIAASIVAPPVNDPDRLFFSGFEAGEVGATSVFTLNQPVEDDQLGSALNMATGDYHQWSQNLTNDNINLFDEGGNGLSVYFYQDQVDPQFTNLVGGVVSGGQYAVLQSGDTIGPASTFSNAVTPMTNWFAGANGYLGIAFVNSVTGQLNYGYIHIDTSGPNGFAAQVFEYGYNSNGTPITIP